MGRVKDFKGDKRKIAIYSRKSKFTGKGESIENQVELCRQYIKDFWFRTQNETIEDVDIDIFEDEGYSGKNTKRPKYQKLLQGIREKKYKALVCYKLDRVSRNVGDFAKLIDELEDYKVAFVSYRDNFDTNTPSGVAMMMMISVFAQFERDTIAERIVDNQLENAKGGRWLGGTTPTGYQSKQIVGSVSEDGRERKAFKLDVIAKEAKLVQFLYKKYMELDSLTKLETYCLQNHIQSKNGKDFSRFTLLTILRNPVYMQADETAWEYFKKKEIFIYSDKTRFDGKHGIMAYNKTDQTNDKSHEVRDMKDWIISVGKHKGIISGEEWTRVQTMLDENQSTSYRKPRSNVALLSGLLKCGGCGSPMRPKLSSRTTADGELIYDYLCKTKELSKGHNCDMKRLNGNMADRMICETVAKQAEPNSKLMKGLERLKSKIHGDSGTLDKEIEILQKAMTASQNEIDGLLKSLSQAEGTAASQYILDEINAKHKNNERLRIQIEALQNQKQEPALSENDFEILVSLLSNFKQSFKTLTVEQKRYHLKAFITDVVWDGEELTIHYFDTSKGETDLTGMDEESDESDGSLWVEGGEPLSGGCERNPHAFPRQQKNCPGCVHLRSHRYRQGREPSHLDGRDFRRRHHSGRSGSENQRGKALPVYPGIPRRPGTGDYRVALWAYRRRLNPERSGQKAEYLPLLCQPDRKEGPVQIEKTLRYRRCPPPPAHQAHPLSR